MPIPEATRWCPAGDRHGWKTRLCAQEVPRDGAGSGAPSRARSHSRHEDGQALEEGASRPASRWHHGPAGSWGLVPRNVCSPAASQSKPALACAFPTAKRLCEHLWANQSKKGGRRGRESRGDFKLGRVQEAVATCPGQEVLSPSFSGEKASQKPSLLGGGGGEGDAPPARCPACPPEPVPAPLGSSRPFVNQGPAVLTSDGAPGTSPGRNQRRCPVPLQGCCAKTAPSAGRPTLRAPRRGLRCQEELQVYRFSPGWYWGSVEVK